MQRIVPGASTRLRGLRALPLTCAIAVALILGACGKDEPAAPAAKAPATATAPAAQPAVPAAAPAPAPALAQLPVPELLKNATAAVAEERLITPPGNSAIEYYLAVLAQEPNNIQATQALVDLFPMMASIGERAIAQKDVVEAERMVALLERASPDSYTVSTIKTKVEQLKQSMSREEERKLAAEQAATQAATTAAQQQVTQRATEAAAAAPAPAPARPAPAPAAASDAAAETPAPTQVASATPPPAEAAPPRPAAPALEKRDAQVLRSVQPGYPPEAVRKRQEGWVELEFTIGPDGRVSNVSVARAQPSRVFDREAIRAMQQWTFRPAVDGGQPIQSRRKQRMEFKLGG